MNNVMTYGEMGSGGDIPICLIIFAWFLVACMAAYPIAMLGILIRDIYNWFQNRRKPN